MNLCAPSKYDNKNKTCLSDDQVFEMAKAYNRYVAKHKFGVKNMPGRVIPQFIEIKPDKQYILSEMKKRFGDLCGNDELCLTQQIFMNELSKEMRNDIDENTFRAVGPEKSDEWLSNVDINNILRQYEKIYLKFKFLGAVPLNCSELDFCSLYQLDFQEFLNNNINQIGIVFNLDKYGQPGSHWVSMFIDIPKNEINYCDSAGKPPRSDIVSIINKFKKFCQKNGKEIIYHYNTTQYQKDTSECGVYSTNFILRRLSGESFQDIITNYLSFNEINSCRNVYFRNKSSKEKAHTLCAPDIAKNL